MEYLCVVIGREPIASQLKNELVTLDYIRTVSYYNLTLPANRDGW